MKNVTFDFRTVGGVANMYAIPLASLNALTKNYATGLYSMTLSDTSNVIKIERYADETFSFSETHGRDGGGDYWDVSVAGAIPKHSTDNAVVIEQLERGEWLVVTEDQNGSLRVCGDEDTQLTFSSDANTGAGYTERNQTTFTFSGRLAHPSWVLNAFS